MSEMLLTALLLAGGFAALFYASEWAAKRLGGRRDRDL